MSDDDDNYEIIGLQPSTRGGALTEQEILNRLKESLKEAAVDADRLGNGERGDIYPRFRENLRLVDGCCRQMSGWREDLRWSAFGVYMHELQPRVGRWIVEKQPGWKFKSVAEILRFALAQALGLETKKTGRVGMILPEMASAPRREGAPVSMGGLILPPKSLH